VVLIIDDQTVARRAMARTLRPYAIVRPAGCLFEGRNALDCEPVSGLIVDLKLPDGSGLELVEELGRRGSRLPTLVISATQSVLEVSHASRWGAAFVSKDEEPDEIVRRIVALAYEARRYGQLRETLAGRLATEYALTPAESETLALFARHGQRDRLSAELDIAETSVRSRVRGICRKLGIKHLETVFRLLFEASLVRPS
jgi:DNA-binding NarL/FixJ family response regulator